MKDKIYTNDDFFISFEAYQAEAGLDKTCTDYLIAYLTSHPHAQQYLTAISNNQDGSRLFDRLPSSFWSTDLEQEYSTAYKAAKSDFAKNKIDIAKLSLEEYAEQREKFDEMEMTALAGHVHKKIETATSFLMTNDNISPAIISALSSLNINSDVLKKQFTNALYTSYSQCISDYATEAAKQKASTMNDLHTIMDNFSVALFTPISKISSNRDAIAADQAKYLCDLKELNDKLNLELFELDEEIKKYHEHNLNYDELSDQLTSLNQIIIKNSLLIRNNLHIPSNYVSEQKELAGKIYNGRLKKYSEILNTCRGLVEKEIDHLISDKDWGVIADPKLSELKQSQIDILVNVKDKLEQQRSLAQRLVDGNLFVSSSKIAKDKFEIIKMLKEELLPNPLIKEKQGFFTQLFNKLIEALFHARPIKSPLEKVTNSFIDKLNHLDLSSHP